MNQTPLNPDALEAAARALLAVQQPEVSADYAWNVQFDDGREELRKEAAAAVSAYLAAALPEVTSVEELDQLPVGSIIADLYDERGNAPVVLCKALNRDWAALTTGTQNGRPWWTSEEIAQVARRLRVLHRPEVKP